MPEQKTAEELLVELSQTCSEIVESQAEFAQSVTSFSTQAAGFDARITANAALATSSTAGKVKPDNETITVDADGVISSQGGGGNGGSGRNIGEVFYSIIPLVDASIHLLNGGIIYSDGIYSAFVEYMAGLYTAGDNPNLFCTETEFQTSITNYGVCGKFVYNSTAGTLRLPQVTGLIEGTVNENAIGDLVEAGLPNITGSIGMNGNTMARKSGAIYQSGPYTQANGLAYGTNGDGSLEFDASLSNPIYGNSDTVQPQAIKGYVYIVLANSVKTQIAVDIDEIATELNGKADVDLTNCTKPHVVETWRSGTEWYRVWSDGWIEQGGKTATANPTTVNLNKPMSDTSYCIVTTGGFVDTKVASAIAGGSDMNAVVISLKTVSSFSLGQRNITSNRYVSWYACGY